MPHEDIIYFGDTKHLPYGEKSKEAIIEYSVRIAHFLIQQNCKAIVVACNTATANALHEVQSEIDGHAFLFDVINPVALQVAEKTTGEVGVIATKATVRTGLYHKSIHEHNKRLKVHELATPLLVPAIEEGFVNHPITQMILTHYLSSKKLEAINTLILGCTHYPLLTKDIKHHYGKRVNIIDSPKIVAELVQRTLRENDLLNNDDHEPVYRFYLSDITQNFKNISKRFFGNEISLELKNLEK